MFCFITKMRLYPNIFFLFYEFLMLLLNSYYYYDHLLYPRVKCVLKM